MTCADAVVDKNAGWSWTKMRGPIGIAPDHSAPERSPSPSLRDLTVSNARGERGRERPKNGGGDGRRIARVVREDVTEVLFAVDRQWWDGSATRQWRGGVAAQIGHALDEGMTPAAAAEALNAWGDPLDREGKVVLNVKRALRVMRCDLRMGLACLECGRPEVLGNAGYCAAHLRVADFGPLEHQGTPVAEELEVLPVEQRVQAYLGVGMSLGPSATSTPKRPERSRCRVEVPRRAVRCCAQPARRVRTSAGPE